MITLPVLQSIKKTESDNTHVVADTHTDKKRKVYIESYGCQMNFSDSEIVSAILFDAGYDATSKIDQADLVLLNTCSIRDNAEQKIRHRLKEIQSVKNKNPELTVGVLGCMAERLKTKLLEEEKIVDLVAGPDAYRDLPNLLEDVDAGQKAVNVFLSREETYADITPIRLHSNGITAFISIMRGCDNMCSFCVVPFTRGRERSRDPKTIIQEAKELFSKGYREVTLLGQNVDSYMWQSEDGHQVVNFAQLLEQVALIDPLLRVRFSTSHPKDITYEVLYTMQTYENICKYIHLPVQSGSSRILELMHRTYTKEWYLDRIDAIRRILGESCGISTDTISGFCTETEYDHRETLAVMRYAQYDFAYMFAYSERPNTPAAKKYPDDVDETTKKRRLSEVIALQNELSLQRNQADIGKVMRVLIEGASKRSDLDFQGRNSANKVVVFPRSTFKKGDYVDVLIESCTAATLKGRVVQLVHSYNC